MTSEELVEVVKEGETSRVQFKLEMDEDKLTDNAVIARLLQQGKELFADEMEIDGTGGLFVAVIPRQKT